MNAANTPIRGMRATRIKGTLRNQIIGFLLLLAIILMVNLPTISMFGTALKTRTTAMTDVRLVPGISEWSIESFSYVIRRNIPASILNSLKVALAVTVSCVVVACMAGYALCI